MDFYNKALQIDLEVFGDNHPDVAIDYNNLGMAYRDVGDKQKAVHYLKQALTIMNTVYGPDHPSVKIFQNNINSIKDGGQSK